MEIVAGPVVVSGEVADSDREDSDDVDGTAGAVGSLLAASNSLTGGGLYGSPSGRRSIGGS